MFGRRTPLNAPYPRLFFESASARASASSRTRSSTGLNRAATGCACSIRRRGIIAACDQDCGQSAPRFRERPAQFDSVHFRKVHIDYHACPGLRHFTCQQRARPVESSHLETSGAYQPCQRGQKGRIVVHDQNCRGFAEAGRGRPLRPRSRAFRRALVSHGGHAI